MFKPNLIHYLHLLQLVTISRPLVGVASDAYGRKKTLLVVPGPTSSSAVMPPAFFVSATSGDVSVTSPNPSS